LLEALVGAETFREAVERLAWATEQHEIPIRLYLDEAEKLIDLERNELEPLRSIMQDAEMLWTTIAASKGIGELNDRGRDWITSPFLFGFRMYPISMLDEEEAAQLIRQERHPQGPVIASDSIVEEIIHASGGHPYLIQILCDRIYQSNRTLRPIKEEDLVVDEWIDSAFRDDFRHFSPAEQQIMEVLGKGAPLGLSQLVEATKIPPERLKLFLHGLERMRYIRPKSDGYEPGNLFLINWLRWSKSPLITAHVSDQASLEMTISDPQPLNIAVSPRRQAAAIANETSLTLCFETHQGAVTITWESEDIGVRRSSFVTPFRGNDLATVVRALDFSQHPITPLSAADTERLVLLGLPLADGLPDERLVPAVGRTLFQALVNDPNAVGALDTAMSHARRRGEPLALRLRFPKDNIELAALPWELLWGDGVSPLLFAHVPPTSCTRHLDFAEGTPPLRRYLPPLRILAIMPHAGVDDSTRARERAERRAAWEPLIESGEVLMHELSPATRRTLVDYLTENAPPDIVHFVGLSRYLDGQGWVILDGSNGAWDRVPVGRLIPLFGGARLVVLCSCQSAMSSEEGLLTGIAPALSAAGVPAVVAMQLTIRTGAATRFSEVLYRSLAKGDSLQYAVIQARQALYVEEADGVSWFVPTLTIRSQAQGPFYLFGE